MVKSKYLFHFIISGTINTAINYLRKNLKFKKNSDLFEYMINLMSKNIRCIKSVIGDHKSEYELIDSEDITRIDKYVRLSDNNYKMLKKWHYLYNEYGISVILRDIIKFFYEGIIKYGAEKFLNMIGKKINAVKIKKDMNMILAHMARISVKKRLIFSLLIDNLPIYV
ncbi:MAG: hypothetical protein KA885_00830 [Spirochaetes bacterium]|nr:hypothetical protein [Spirochaetota bacterium]